MTRRSPQGQRRVRLPTVVYRSALVIFCASVALARFLLVFGGFEVVVFGLRIRSNDPVRPLYLVAIALVVRNP